MSTERPLHADPGGRYAVQGPGVNEPAVDLWTVERLKFDAKPAWQKELVRQLRTDLLEIPVREGEALNALYVSDDRQKVDAENVLLYNVGEAAFANVTSQLRFERSFRPAPPPPLPLATRPRYHHRYERCQPGREFASWARVDGEIASWFDVPCPRVAGDRAGWHIWLAMRRGGDSVRTSPEVALERPGFGVRVEVVVPPGFRTRPAAIVKGVVDGVIASFQRYGPDESFRASEVARRISPTLGSSEAEILDALSVPGALFAGSPFNMRGRPALNPHDDPCVAGEIAVAIDTAARTPRLSGSVFPVVERAAAR